MRKSTVAVAVLGLAIVFAFAAGFFTTPRPAYDYGRQASTAWWAAHRTVPQP